MKTLDDYVKLLEEERIISLSKEVEDNMNDKFRSDFSSVAKKLKNEEDKTIGIVINTNGGDAPRAFQLQTEIQAIAKKYEVWLICGSPDDSGGVIISLSLPSDRRVGFANCSIYAHYARTGWHSITKALANQLDYDVKELYQRAEGSKYYNKMMIDLVIKETNLTRLEAKELFDNPRFIRGRQAVKMGFISRILK
jgi:ATP-dependent protease ClpP protease subunit